MLTKFSFCPITLHILTVPKNEVGKYIISADGIYTDTLYAYRVFSRDDVEEANNTSNLTNSVTLTAGEDTKGPDDPTDEAETPAGKLYTVTVKYVDDDGNPVSIKVNGTAVSEQIKEKLENGTKYREEVQDWIYTGFVDENGNHYVSDGEKVTTSEGKDYTDNTINNSDLVITVTYTLDNWDEGNPDKPDPDPENPNPDPGPDKPDPDPENPGDNVGDKYQVKVIYRVKDKSAEGYIDKNGKTSKTVILNIAKGTISAHVTEGYVNLPVVTAISAEGTRFTGWSVGTGNTGLATGWPPISGTSAALKGGRLALPLVLWRCSRFPTL